MAMLPRCFEVPQAPNAVGVRPDGAPHVRADTPICGLSGNQQRAEARLVSPVVLLHR